MIDESIPGQRDGTNWQVGAQGHPGVRLEFELDASGDKVLTMLSHPDRPFFHEVGLDDEALFDLAETYLRRIEAIDGSPRGVSARLNARTTDGFGWLPLAPSGAAVVDPRQSYELKRLGHGTPAERSVVLLAANREPDNTNTARSNNLGGGIGLQVVMHIGAAQAGKRAVRITGARFCALALSWLTAVAIPARTDVLAVALDSLRAAIGASKAAIDGIVVALQGNAYRLSGTALDSGAGGQVFAWGGQIAAPGKDSPAADWQFTLDYRTPMVAHGAQGSIKVFKVDPASQPDTSNLPPHKRRGRRRPTRPDAELDLLRKDTERLPPDKSGMPPKVKALKEPTGSPRFETLQKRPPKQTTDAVQEVPSDTLPLRSRHLGASHTYLRAKELFDRIDAYGLPPHEIFRFASLPLKLRHDAPVGGAADGDTVNAQVRPDGPGPSLYDPPTVPLPRLEVTFGSASLTHRRRTDIGGGRRRVEPLGLAADRRWAWHEFGHVLCYGATGWLEYPFAHSTGDALAAIVCDPGSALQTTAAARGMTFPWVQTRRRHDRDAAGGWCWCGRRNTRRLFYDPTQPPDKPPRPTGYFAEQLMSSSLFRFYLAIGGATSSGPDEQQRASDYATYLIMRAPTFSGPAHNLPLRTAEQFVDALMHADICTTFWDVKADWPEPDTPGSPKRDVRRIGGTVHKVLRWAFERQGLYATDQPRHIAEGPGLPPPQDVYVPGIGARAGGSYEPVPLLWSDTAEQPWHAAAGALHWTGTTLSVQVKNRGTHDATGVSVCAWIAAPGAALVWELATLISQPVVIGPGGTATFQLTTPKPSASGWFVLAAARSDGDRSTLEPITGLPCVTPTTGPVMPPKQPWRVLDLVANDNNQGLRVVA